MKKLTLILALMFAGTVFAETRAVMLDAPFVPTEAVSAAVTVAPGWTEIYRVPLNRAKSAKKALVEQSQPPPPIAVSVGGRIYFSIKQAPAQLEEISTLIFRKGAVVEYADDCKIIPEKGDTVKMVFQSNDKEAEIIITGTLLEHFAFGSVSEIVPEPIRLDLRKPEHCSAVTESRILSEGQLQYKVNGKTVLSEHVLVQFIVQP